MTTAYTSLLGLALPVTGELSGTWGQTVNDSITSLLDSAIAGTTTLSTDADVTLTTTTGAANTAREAILLCSGARTGIKTITAPAQSKIYTVINATTGGFAVKLVGVGPTTGLTIPNGASAVVAWNGSDFIEIGSASVGNFTVNGNLAVTGTSTLTGAVTLSGGTANGVGYLNGSKVLTTGTALTFDGTNFATTGEVLLNNARYYNGKTSGGANVRLLGINSGDVAYVGPIDSGPNSTILSASSTSLNTQFYAAGSEQMRLTSTGLGIGTSSPGAKLDVNGTVQFKGGNTFLLLNSDNTNYYFLQSTGATGSANAKLEFLQSGVGTRLTLDSSGNLGLGVTPSAWSAITAMQVKGAALGSTGNELYLYANAYYASGTAWTYKNSATAFGYEQNGAHKWFTAPSGTAGNAITFTQAMTLDASGNLGVGTTSPVAKLDVNGTIYSRTGGIYTDTVTAYSGSSISINAGSSNLNIVVNASERMRIDSAGNVGIGTSSPGYKLGISGVATTYASSASIALYDTVSGVAASRNWLIGNVAAGNYGELNFVVSSAAGGAPTNSKMTLDSSGNLGLGVTPSASAILDAQSTTKGVRFPNMTTTQKNAISSPAAGLMVFDTTLAKLCVYSGSAWQTITSI